MHRASEFGQASIKNSEQTNLEKFSALFCKKSNHVSKIQPFHPATTEKYIFLYFFDMAEKASMIMQFLKRILNCRIIATSTKNHTMTEAFLSLDTNKCVAVEVNLKNDTCNIPSSLAQMEISEKEPEADKPELNESMEQMNISSNICSQDIITWLEMFFASLNVNVGLEELDLYLDHRCVSCIDRILSGQNLTTNIFTKKNLDFWLLFRDLRENIKRHTLLQELTPLAFTPENFVELYNSNVSLSNSLRSANLRERNHRVGNLEVARFLTHMNANGELDNYTTRRLLLQLNVSAMEVHRPPILTSLNLLQSRAQ